MAASPSVGVIHKYAKSEHYQSIHKDVLSGVTRSLSFIVPLTFHMLRHGELFKLRLPALAAATARIPGSLFSSQMVLAFATTSFSLRQTHTQVHYCRRACAVATGEYRSRWSTSASATTRSCRSSALQWYVVAQSHLPTCSLAPHARRNTHKL